jgi:hypothetical protein
MVRGPTRNRLVLAEVVLTTQAKLIPNKPVLHVIKCEIPFRAEFDIVPDPGLSWI